MCGITGLIGNSSNVEDTLKKMVDALSHRGPDSIGLFSHHNIGLGHARLSIQDLSENGHQPMISDDGRYVLVFNGEIYNHWELRKSLKNTRNYHSSCDTETLLYGLIEEGEKFIAKLNGIFAFSFYDKSENTMLIARDHFGTKPLYYYQYGDQFGFASEIKSLIAIDGFNKDVNPESFVYYLNYLYAPGETTPFRSVKKLLPGYFIKINCEAPSKFKTSKYYQIPYQGVYTETVESTTINNLEKHLKKAVERQLLADVEIGYFLSGGLDSSILAVMAKEYSDKPLKCYSIVTKESEKEGFASDIHYARKIAKKNNFELNEIEVDVNIIEEFDKIIYHLDEPQADPAPINVLKICQQARQDGLKVLIGGTAGDDLFSGYRRHQALKYDWVYNTLPGPLGKGFRSLINGFDKENPKIRRIAKFSRGFGLSQNERMSTFFSWLDKDINHSLFSKGVKSAISKVHPEQYLIDRLGDIPNEKNWLNRLLYWEKCGFLPDHNLNYTDKMSMASGIEVRVPFLDQDLVNYACTIDPKLKLKGNEAKYILKKVGEKYLDKEVIYRPKTGFGAPIRSWIRFDLNDMIEEYLSESNLKNRGIFDYKEVRKLIDANKKGTIDASYSIWSLLAIESWNRQFLD